MVQTPSNMMPLGTIAPEFCLPDAVSNQQLCLKDIKSSNATLVMFICNHCPFVKHVQSELARIGEDYIPQGVTVIAINSNDVSTYPEDSPENMKIEAQQAGYIFPYLFDETQAVARAYNAACTPDFFIFNKDLACVYRGQLDASRPGNDIPVSGKDIRQALDNLLAGEPVSEQQTPSVGCNIKWKQD